MITETTERLHNILYYLNHALVYVFEMNLLGNLCS